MLLLEVLTIDSCIKCYNYEVLTDFGCPLFIIIMSILTIIHIFECTIIPCVFLSACLNNETVIILDFN